MKLNVTKESDWSTNEKNDEIVYEIVGNTN